MEESSLRYQIISHLSMYYGGGYDYLIFKIRESFCSKRTKKELKGEVRLLREEGLVRLAGNMFALTLEGERYKKENKIIDYAYED